MQFLSDSMTQVGFQYRVTDGRVPRLGWLSCWPFHSCAVLAGRGELGWVAVQDVQTSKSMSNANPGPRPQESPCTLMSIRENWNTKLMWYRSLCSAISHVVILMPGRLKRRKKIVHTYCRRPWLMLSRQLCTQTKILEKCEDLWEVRGCLRKGKSCPRLLCWESGEALPVDENECWLLNRVLYG